ncbi:MAG TPA: amidohydrolase family protein [Desulfopila sp.]|nr:amidohydrolase family protein [Desulfopila sp.]
MRKKHILAGRLIDGSGSPVQKGACLVVEEGRIVGVAPQNQQAYDNEAEKIDLRHCTLLPPLVDCSLSLGISSATGVFGESRDKEQKHDSVKALRERHLQYCFSHGVLAVADCSDERGFVRQFGSLRGAAKKISIHTATWLPDPRGEGTERSVSLADDFVRVACSADMSWSLADGSFPEAADITALLGQVDAKKRIVVANGERAVTEALKAGCGAVEQGVFMGTTNMSKMAERGIVWIPCLLKLKTLADTAPSHAASLYKKAIKYQIDMLRQARSAGVKVVVGTAAGFAGIIHGESMHEEIKLLRAAGYPLVEALRCASINGAEFLGIDDIGVLQKGGAATFLVTRGTVQQLPRKLGYLEDIYIAGSSSDMYRKNPVKTVYGEK